MFRRRASYIKCFGHSEHTHTHTHARAIGPATDVRRSDESLMYDDIRPNVMTKIEPCQELAQMARQSERRPPGIIRSSLEFIKNKK